MAGAMVSEVFEYMLRKNIDFRKLVSSPDSNPNKDPVCILYVLAPVKNISNISYNYVLPTT